MNTDATLIGPSGEVAAIVSAKAARLRKNPTAPLKTLFYGVPGVGKTHLAWQVARLLAESPFDIEHSNGKNVTIDKVREWLAELPYRSIYGDWQIKIVDELDLCTRDAQDLLLTYLDRLPPGRAFLGTSNLQLDLLAERVQTRLQQLKIEPPSTAQISALLRSKKLPAAMADQLAVGCGGNVRAALLDAETFHDARGVRK
jgi:DNA polymerase III delta prime subunit